MVREPPLRRKTCQGKKLRTQIVRFGNHRLSFGGEDVKVKFLPFAPIAALFFALTLTGMEQPTRAESREDLVRQSLSSESEEAERAIARWRRVLDRLCQQRDGYASQLYWYTDLERMKAAVRRSGKPILSLRLLGHLDEDLSCANSRFFRVAVYKNQGQLAPHSGDGVGSISKQAR